MRFSPNEFEIIDAHTHIYPPKIAVKAAENIGRFYGLPAYCSGGEDELLEKGTRLGVSRFLICSVATVPHQVSFINEFIATAQGEHPDRFIGFGALHPDCDVAAETEKLVSLGLSGIKLHPDFQKFNIDDRAAYPMYEEAVARNLPILFHMGDDRYTYSAPFRLVNILDDFPQLRVIAAHLGGYRVWDQARGILKRDNVWFDASSTLPLIGPERSVDQIRHFGADRVFFGTDFPLWDYDKEFSRFFELPLSYSEYKMILADNFKSFLGV